jgi:hypothetical protein
MIRVAGERLNLYADIVSASRWNPLESKRERCEIGRHCCGGSENQSKGNGKTSTPDFISGLQATRPDVVILAGLGNAKQKDSTGLRVEISSITSEDEDSYPRS